MAGIIERVKVHSDTLNETELSVKLNFAEVIATLAMEIQQLLDLSIILQNTATEVRQLLECDRLLIYQFNADGSGQVVLEAVSAPGWSLGEGLVYDQYFDSDWLEADHKWVREITDIETAEITPFEREFLASFQVKAYLLIPLVSGSQLWGWLIAHSCTESRQWQPQEIQGVQQIAVHVGIAIYQDDLRAQLQSGKTSHLEKLEQTNQQLLAKVEERNEAMIVVHQQAIFLRQVLDSLFTFVGLLTPDGILIEANKTPLEVAGLTREDVINKPFADAYWWSYAVEAQERIREAIAQGRQGKSVRFDIQVQVRGGEMIIIDFALNPLVDAMGKISHLICSGIDITDRKEAELALKKSEARYRNIIETTFEGLWILDPEGKTTFVNEQMAKILGYTREEMLGIPLLHFFSPEDQPETKVYLERRQQGIQERHTSKLLHKDGSFVWVMVSGSPQRDEEGNLIEIIGMITDITTLVTIQEALKISEMQLSRVLDSSLDGIMAFRSVRDDQGNIIDFECLLSNPTAAQLVNKQPEDLIGKRVLVEFPHNREENWFDAYVQVVETDKPYQREFYCNHDGKECWFENIAVKLGDGLAVTFRDIRVIKESEQAIQLVNQQLQERIADLDQRHEEMLILSEISDFMQASLTVQEACQALGSLVINLFPGCSGCLLITNAARNQMEMISSWGEIIHSKHDFQPQNCWGLRRGRTHFYNHQSTGLRCQHILNHSEIAITLCIPMIAHGESLGLFYLSTDTPNALPEAKRQLASTVAEQSVLAIANLNLRETLEHQSIRDPLTGLFNRRYLEEFFTKEIIRAQRKQHEIGVIMIDIDHFKRFNDVYGHDAGDYVLQTVAQTLKQTVRGSDIACRYGGEELTLVLPKDERKAPRFIDGDERSSRL